MPYWVGWKLRVEDREDVFVLMRNSTDGAADGNDESQCIVTGTFFGSLCFFLMSSHG